MDAIKDFKAKDSRESGQASFPWKKYGKIGLGLLLGYALWFVFLIIALRWINPPFTSFTLRQDWEQLGAERYNLRENWVSPGQLPDHLKLAVIASEDQRFRSHWGLDLQAIEKAMEENEDRGRKRGASTITQQVAKNLFLSPAQTYLRKGMEAGITVLIEIFWSKDRIMEVYLNIIEFGAGVFGIGKASHVFFNKPAESLKPMEAAQLAAVLPNPKRMQAEPPSPYVAERRYWILRNMSQLSGTAYLPKPEPDSTLTFPDSLGVDSTGFHGFGKVNLPPPFIPLQDSNAASSGFNPDTLKEKM